MRRTTMILGCLLLAAGVGAAGTAQQSAAARQPATTPVTARGPVHLTLGEALTKALRANPGLKAVARNSGAARREAKAAARGRFGEIDAVGWYSRYHDDEIVRPMAKELLAGGFGDLPFDRNQVHYGVTFTVPLYLGGKLSSGITIAKLESKKAAALAQGTRWQLRFNVASLYTTAQALDQVEHAYSREIQALDKTKERLDIMVESGKRPEVDRLKVVESLEDARAQREAVLAQRTKVGAILLSVLGLDPNTGFEVDPLPDRLPKMTIPVAELRKTVEETSTVQRARLAAEQASRGVSIARSTFIPSVVLSGNYLQNTAPSIDDPLDTWEFRVGVNVPLFAGGARFERLGAARERQAAALENYEKTRLEALSRFEDAVAAWKAALATVKAAEARVAAGVEAARIEQIRYDTGAGTIEDLLRARAREEGARAALARARGEVIAAGERINSIVEKEAVK